MPNDGVVKRLRKGYRHPKPDACPDELYEIMMECWRSEPNERPTFEYLYQILDDFTVSTETGYKDPEQ
jgi:Protein tyrosine and serine/threonine kinase